MVSRPGGQLPSNHEVWSVRGGADAWFERLSILRGRLTQAGQGFFDQFRDFLVEALHHPYGTRHGPPEPSITRPMKY